MDSLGVQAMAKTMSTNTPPESPLSAPAGLQAADWTALLTEEENDNLDEHLHDDQCEPGQCWVTGLFCSLAASRALVAEKDKALKKISRVVFPERMALHNPIGRADIEYIVRMAEKALALTEEEMMG